MYGDIKGNDIVLYYILSYINYRQSWYRKSNWAWRHRFQGRAWGL